GAEGGGDGCRAARRHARGRAACSDRRVLRPCARQAVATRLSRDTTPCTPSLFRSDLLLRSLAMNRLPEVLAASAIAAAIAGAVVWAQPSPPTARTDDAPVAAAIPSGGEGAAFAISAVRVFDGDRVLPDANVV